VSSSNFEDQIRNLCAEAWRRTMPHSQVLSLESAMCAAGTRPTPKEDGGPQLNWREKAHKRGEIRGTARASHEGYRRIKSMMIAQPGFDHNDHDAQRPASASHERALFA